MNWPGCIAIASHFPYNDTPFFCAEIPIHPTSNPLLDVEPPATNTVMPSTLSEKESRIVYVATMTLIVIE